MQRTRRSLASLFCVFLALSFALAEGPHRPPLYIAHDLVVQTADGPITLKAGTAIVVETTQNLNSRNLSPGQNVNVRVKFPIKVEKKVLIAAGAPGTATVTAVKKAKGFGKAGFIELQVTTVQAVDAQQVPISGLPINVEGESRVGLAIGLAVAGAVLLFLVGGVAGLLIKGTEAEMKAGSVANGSVANEIDIEPEN